MRKNCFVFLFAAMVLLAGCAKEETAAPVGDAQSLTVTLSQTKTHLGDREGSGPYTYKIYWSNGDKISVNGTESAELTGLAGTERTATFDFASSLGSAPYSILYPSSVYDDATHVTLPAVQTYKSDGFADGMFPMAGYTADGSNITINHLCSVIKLSVKRASGASADTDNLVSVTFKGKNNEQVSGSFTIDYGAATLTGASSDAADKSVKVVKTLATATDAAAVYYIVVPAQTYSNGFDIIIQDAGGDIMTQSKASSISLVAGKLYSTPEIVFVPTGEADPTLTIDTAVDLIAFATDYNNKVYEGQDDLVVALSGDIAFDAMSSAAFNATGGIGQKDGVGGATEDNYFLGIFDGGGHTISGLTATVPLFAFTDSGSQIKDLTLSSTCSLTVDSPAVDSNHGALVGRNKGLVKNCTSNANVTINNIQDVSTAEQHYGGLVGRNYGGTIDGCSVTGNITCSQTGQTLTDNAAFIAGIVGTQADTGTTNDCTFTGNITISDNTTYGGITAAGKYFYVAGIVGYADDGVISNCTAGDALTPTSIDVRGTFVPAVGGILGWSKTAADSEISVCDNYMSLSVASNGARANTTPLRIGGIAARAAAPVNGCTNSGAISSVSNSTTVYLGGIVADGANVDDCTNNAGGTLTRTNAEADAGQTNRYMYIGGIMGGANAAGDITDCTNHADIISNPIGTATATTLDLGGIVGGGNGKQMDISGCTNDGEIKLNNDNESAVATARSAIGGILGYVSTASTTVSGCANEGKVWSNNNKAGSYGTISIGGTIGRVGASCSVTDCTNSGEILCQNPGAAISAYVDLGGIVGLSEATVTISGTTADATLNSGPVTVSQASSAIIYARNTQGGILGYSKGNNTKITNCKNTAKIYCDLSGTGANNRPSYTGGIVGLLASVSYSSDAASGLSGLSGIEIGNCNNIGEVNSANYNNKGGNKTAPFAGGIAGLASGKSDSKVYVHDCTVGTQTVYVYRGFGGGVIAYANYSTIEDNVSSANMSSVNVNVTGVGGIVGRLFDSSMSNCTFSGSIARAKNIGGLVYSISEQNTDAGSSITDCKVNGATLTTGTGTGFTAAAVLVSVTDAKANTITNCGVKGTIDSAAITLSSNMITTDGGTTVTGTYLIP